MSATWHDRDRVFDGTTGWDEGAVVAEIIDDDATAKIVTGSGLATRRGDYTTDHLALVCQRERVEGQVGGDDFDDGQKTVAE